MTSLTEYEDPTFLDQTIIHEETRDLAIDVAARASRLAGNHFFIETLSNTTWYSASKQSCSIKRRKRHGTASHAPQADLHYSEGQSFLVQ